MVFFGDRAHTGNKRVLNLRRSSGGLFREPLSRGRLREQPRRFVTGGQQAGGTWLIHASPGAVSRRRTASVNTVDAILESARDHRRARRSRATSVTEPLVVEGKVSRSQPSLVGAEVGVEKTHIKGHGILSTERCRVNTPARRELIIQDSSAGSLPSTASRDSDLARARSQPKRCVRSGADEVPGRVG